MTQPKIEMTTMVMVEDKKAGKVLVQDRIKRYKGYSFPGGHVENGESFYDCAVREVKEETGLDIRSLQYCGVINWFNSDTCDRYLVYLYKTSDFTGELLPKSDEGKNSWLSLGEMKAQMGDIDIGEYMPLFLDDKVLEGFCAWRKGDKEWKMEYR